MAKEITPTKLPVEVTLKGLKQAGGEETPRFEASLCLRGKKVAIVSNSGTGGPNMYHWQDRSAEAEVTKVAEAYYAEKNPGQAPFEVVDSLVYGIMDQIDCQKIAKNNAKKGYRITLVVKADGEWGVRVIGYGTRKGAMEAMAKEPETTTYSVVHETSDAEADAYALERARKDLGKKGFPFLYEVVAKDGQKTFVGYKRLLSDKERDGLVLKEGLVSLKAV